MIKLFEDEMIDQGRRSSKGNQFKFKRDNIWYKTDYLGYEGLTEFVVSKLISFSDLKESEYTDYELEQIDYNDTVFNGCMSVDFTNGKSLITLERLFKNMYGRGLNNIIYSITDHKERLHKMVEQVERVTGIKGFGIYMSKVLTIDALFLNEDRHTHNIALMSYDKGKYSLSPIFDNGAGLLSDTRIEYPLGKDVITLMEKVNPKTFCDSFDEQLDIAEELYGQYIKFYFEYKDVKQILDSAVIYDDETKKRVCEIIMQMRRKYAYLFCEKESQNTGKR